MVGVVTLVAMLGAAAGSSDPAAGAVTASPGRWVSGDFTNAAGTRHWSLYLPAGYDQARKHMLVVLLHGCTQDAADIARGTRIAEHADREGFIALLPEQPASANPKKCWNWYDPAHQGRGGEPSIIDGLTAQVMRDYAVDPERVHLAGISAGAAMASLVAVAYPERWASVAFHSGLPWRAATSVAEALAAMATGAANGDSLAREAAKAMGEAAHPIPALVVQGGSDRVVNPANAEALGRQWVLMNSAIAAREGPMIGVIRDPDAEPPDERGETASYHWVRKQLARGNLAVETLVVAELGHAWSGGSSAGTFTDERGPDAAAEMVAFFRAHPRGR